MNKVIEKLLSRRSDNDDVYACTLLFQFRNENSQEKRRLCEERIFKLFAVNIEEAYKKSLSIGKREECIFEYSDRKQYYEFIGILELVELSLPEEDDEIWHRYVELKSPLERYKKIIPEKSSLSVFRRQKRLSFN
jgi:hypothetical protein